MKNPLSNSDNRKFDKLTSDILKKYHEGGLTNQEMHQVEKMLLDDPFAAEALEGIESAGDALDLENIEQDLNQLIDERTNKRKTKIIPIYQRPWNIAAAVALLITASYLLFNNTELINPSAKSQGPIALEKSTVPDSSENNKLNGFEEQDLAGVIDNNDTTPDQKQAGSIQKLKTESKQDPKIRSVGDDQLANAKTGISDKKNDLVAVNVEEEIDKEKDTELVLGEAIAETLEDNVESSVADLDSEEETSGVPKPVTRSKASPAKKAISQSRRNEAAGAADEAKDKGKSIFGQVISAEDGRGLPGVTLSIKGTTKGTYTDINGNYSLPVIESDSIIQYSFIGYETEEIILEKQDKIDIELESNEMALSEVVVIAYDDEENDEVIPIESALPEGGNSGYKRYLKDNLHYPADALDNKVEGKVKVTFFVQSDGKLSDFEIKRSLGYGCDQEVIRLIKQGPNWKPAKKGDTLIKQKVKVRVKFKLEK